MEMGNRQQQKRKKMNKHYREASFQFHGSSHPFGPSLITKSIMAWTASATLLERE